MCIRDRLYCSGNFNSQSCSSININGMTKTTGYKDNCTYNPSYFSCQCEGYLNSISSCEAGYTLQSCPTDSSYKKCTCTKGKYFYCPEGSVCSNCYEPSLNAAKFTVTGCLSGYAEVSRYYYNGAYTEQGASQMNGMMCAPTKCAGNYTEVGYNGEGTEYYLFTDKRIYIKSCSKSYQATTNAQGCITACQYSGS